MANRARTLKNLVDLLGELDSQYYVSLRVDPSIDNTPTIVAEVCMHRPDPTSGKPAILTRCSAEVGDRAFEDALIETLAGFVENHRKEPRS